MNSQYRVSGLLLAGFLTLAAGTPASALTEDGKNLLERIRSRIEAKEAAAEKPVETVAPPAEFTTQTPPAQEFEPGSIVVEPTSGKQPEADEKKAKKTASQSEKKGRTPRKAKSDTGEKREISKPQLPPPTPPAAHTAPAAATADVTTDSVQPPSAARAQAPAPAGSARSFGELTDAELIQYAQDHMWSKEKSRKHNPPWTPPSKPKKKKDDKQKAATAPTKSDSKKAGAAQTKKAAAKGKS